MPLDCTGWNNRRRHSGRRFAGPKRQTYFFGAGLGFGLFDGVSQHGSFSILPLALHL
jgi:hypothetical protein